MQYGDIDVEDVGPQTRTAYREAEKKYQLFRERAVKMKRGKKKQGKLVTRPIDMSDVMDLYERASDSLPPGVVRHVVRGSEGPVFTFARHPGLVYMPGALPSSQQLVLTTAALIDYPEPPARTNHALHYGPLPGLWRAAQQGLRLNWGRRDEPPAGSSGRQACEQHSPVETHLGRAPFAEASNEAGSPGTDATAATVVAARPDPNPDPDLGLVAPTGGSSGAGGGAGCACCSPGQGWGRWQVKVHGQDGCPGTDGSEGAKAPLVGEATTAVDTQAAQQQQQEQQQLLLQGGSASGTGAESQRTSNGMGVPGHCGGPATAAVREAAAVDVHKASDEDRDGHGCCCSNRSSSSGGASGGGDRSYRSSGSDCVDEVEAAPSFEECWSADGPGPPAEKLLRKLRWATLGPQFEWTQRRYDFSGVFRPLPPSLESVAKQLAAVVDNLQAAGLEVLPPSGDVLGGHLDDVERDMAQPIVSVSLGCPAIFLMGGPTKQLPPSAILLRGGDVMVLAGEARRCYHGVPRILEVLRCGLGDQEACEGGGSPFGNYMRCSRINISIRTVA